MFNNIAAACFASLIALLACESCASSNDNFMFIKIADAELVASLVAWSNGVIVFFNLKSDIAAYIT